MILFYRKLVKFDREWQKCDSLVKIDCQSKEIMIQTWRLKKRRDVMRGSKNIWSSKDDKDDILCFNNIKQVYL